MGDGAGRCSAPSFAFLPFIYCGSCGGEAAFFSRRISERISKQLFPKREEMESKLVFLRKFNKTAADYKKLVDKYLELYYNRTTK